MKTFSKIFITAIIIFGLGISSSFATNKVEEINKVESTLEVSFLEQNLDQMVVSFEASGEEVELSLINENGKSVHTEAISGKGVFAKRYDLSELDKGVYSFQVKRGNKHLEKTVVLK